MSRILVPVCAWLLLGFLAPRSNSAPPGDDEVRASMRRSSSRGTPQGWTFSTVYKDIKDYADRPDEQTLNALGVEWRNPEWDALGNFCSIRGRVRMPANGQGRTKVISWFQGVAVYMGTRPAARPDWSRGMNRADSLSDTAVTSPAGLFHVRFDMRKTNYDRSRGHLFQFGMALAKHTVIDETSQEVVWDSRTPAVLPTVQMLSVPPAPALSRELQRINRASSWPFSDPNGLELIRAVNALQPLGKERSLAVLEKYADLTRTRDYFSEQEIVFWIIRLLFEPIRPDDRIPSPMIAVFLVDHRSVEALKWPLNPIAVSGDVPFMLGRRIGMGGLPEQPSSHIRWARIHGVIRDGLLAPTANPLAAAEAILQSRRFKALDDFSRAEATRSIRLQARAMVKGMLPPNRARADAGDDGWRADLKAVAERGIHWDAKREQFVGRE